MFSPRPCSPPPPCPSPEPQLQPLHPPRRLRKVSSNISSTTSPDLYSVRSSENLREWEIQHKRLLNKLDGLSKSRSRSDLRASEPSTPRSLPASSPPRSPSLSGDFKKTHRRSLSVVLHQHSPPRSPLLSAPPVPPIPSYALAPTDKKPVLHPQSPSPIISSIFLPDLHSLSPVSSRSGVPQPKVPHRLYGYGLPDETDFGMSCGGMTCAKFFSLRNHTSRAI